MWFEIAVGMAAGLAGIVASVAGFGIGSLLTPLLAWRLGTKLAVAAVSIPHVIGTAIRFWLLRGHVDRRIFLWFGLTSAAGGLAGALLHAYASSRALGTVLGCLLVFVGISELSGLMQHVRFGRRAAPEPHVLHQARKLGDADEHQQTPQDRPKRPARGVGVQERAREAARRAGQAEPQEDAAVDVTAQEPESDRGADYMGNGDRGHGELRPQPPGQQRRQQAADAEARH